MNDKDLMKKLSMMTNEEIEEEAKELMDDGMPKALIKPIWEDELLKEQIANTTDEDIEKFRKSLGVTDSWHIEVEIKEHSAERKKWYIFESSSEGTSADMCLLSDEEAKVIKSFFDNRIRFYDEGYAGEYEMLESGPYDTKEEVVNQFIKDGIITNRYGGTFNLRHSQDFVGEFKDMYKEEEE